MLCLKAILIVSTLLTLTTGTSAHDMAGHSHSPDPRIIVQEVNPWTNLDFNNDPDQFQFAIVTDRTGGCRPGVFEDAVTKLNLLQPEFVVSVGDLIEGYTEDLDQLELEWSEFQGSVAELEMPFFYTPGNHDITNPVMAEEWQKRFGRSWYSYVYRDVLFLHLNTEDGEPSHIGEEQLAFIETTLAENSAVRWTLLFQHKPLWNYNRDTGWSRVEELLAGRPHTVFAGHFHTYTKHVRNNSNYFVLATTGGGSSLRGPLYGEFDHVVWVTMLDEGPRIANLMLEGIRDENIRTAEMAALTDALMYGLPAGIHPFYTSEGTFQDGATTLTLSNSATLPLQLTGKFDLSGKLTVIPAEIDLLMEPESDEIYKLTLIADTELSPADISPVLFSWTAEYEQEELELPVIENSTWLTVVNEYRLEQTDPPITVDGSLGEWELPFSVQEPAVVEVTPEAWTGAADCSWRFGVVQQQDQIYIGVEVTDDVPVYRGGMAWEQDGIEVRFDAREDPVRAQHRGNGENYHHLIFALGPDPDREDMTIWDPETHAEVGAKAACQTTATGVNYEMAIPVSYLIEQQGEEWRRFRLNIAVDDFDNEDGPLAQLWWQPDWRDEENVPGSGTFRK